MQRVLAFGSPRRQLSHGTTIHHQGKSCANSELSPPKLARNGKEQMSQEQLPASALQVRIDPQLARRIFAHALSRCTRVLGLQAVEGHGEARTLVQQDDRGQVEEPEGILCRTSSRGGPRRGHSEVHVVCEQVVQRRGQRRGTSAREQRRRRGARERRRVRERGAEDSHDGAATGTVWHQPGQHLLLHHLRQHVLFQEGQRRQPWSILREYLLVLETSACLLLLQKFGSAGNALICKDNARSRHQLLFTRLGLRK
mmetsp:Transcript_21176/g.59128  ORF Transcript_21176/g.59128 Transcript_21176/m.59128 type:complete len:255 (-) Transcript_21176:891-1655(-)